MCEDCNNKFDGQTMLTPMTSRERDLEVSGPIHGRVHSGVAKMEIIVSTGEVLRTVRSITRCERHVPFEFVGKIAGAGAMAEAGDI